MIGKRKRGMLEVSDLIENTIPEVRQELLREEGLNPRLTDEQLKESGYKITVDYDDYQTVKVQMHQVVRAKQIHMNAELEVDDLPVSPRLK